MYEASKRTVDPAGDLEWHHKIDLIIVPNPKLDDDRRRAQEIEHKMEDGRLTITCRLSMAFYLLAEHKLAVESGKLTELEQPLILDNVEEVSEARKVARKLAKEALKRADT